MKNAFDLFGIAPSLQKLAQGTQEDIKEEFEKIENIQSVNEAKVLKAFCDNRISESHLLGSVGYGYDDRGRDGLDAVVSQVFSSEDALVRHNFVSGTHALTVALFGVLRPGDWMVSITGSPYDTMEEVIGIRGEGHGSLKDFGVLYRQLERLPDGNVDIEGIPKAVCGAKVAYIQRSRGYSLFPALTIAQIEEIIATIKTVNPDIYVVVDNCYGEFVELEEPTAIGADLIVGSLIKNPGGGIAKTGGYIAGKRELVQMCAYRLTAPGVGKEVGATLDQNRSMYMGLFFAPSVVANALKTSCFALRFFEYIGFDVYPKYNAPRTDIIATVCLETKKRLLAFCKGIQSGSPVDSFVTPMPWDMPGYDEQVIMAAGTFTSGASIEISADAPMKAPYPVYLQGGLTYCTGQMSVLLAAQEMLNQGLLDEL